MMLPWLTGLISMIALLIIAGSIWLYFEVKSGSADAWKKAKEILAVVIFIGVISYGAASIGIIVGRVYIVQEDGQIETHFAFGNPTYVTADGESHSLDPHCVVNNTPKEMLIESVVYGNGEFEDDMPIATYDFQKIDSPGVIHYFFSDKPPRSIEGGSTGGASQLWLRYR